MALPAKTTFPQPATQWLVQQQQLALAQYFAKLDALVTALAQGSAPVLVNAINDVAAAKAGVGVGQFYRNGSVVMVRVT